MNQSPEELSSEIHRFSSDVLELAKELLAGNHSDELKARAKGMGETLRGLSERANAVDDEYQPGFKKVLSEAMLDLSWIASDGMLPSSIRIGHIMAEE